MSLFLDPPAFAHIAPKEFPDCKELSERDQDFEYVQMLTASLRDKYDDAPSELEMHVINAFFMIPKCSLTYSMMKLLHSS